ncbi:MAG: hypothetical protein WC791_00535 [Candidatus Paceibacterota bacterium]
MKSLAKNGLKPATIRGNNMRQRSDVSLSKEVASALMQLILSGKSLFPPSGKIEVMVQVEGCYKACILSSNTVNSWVKRGTIIPETEEVLRDVLDRARETYRTRNNEEKKKRMLCELEKHFYRTIKLRTDIPLRDRSGKVIQKEDGSLILQENPELLKVKMKTAMFLAERLMPEIYGKKDKVVSKQSVFSLSELRSAKEGRI